jgi:hypothetical protein
MRAFILIALVVVMLATLSHAGQLSKVYVKSAMAKYKHAGSRPRQHKQAAQALPVFLNTDYSFDPMPETGFIDQYKRQNNPFYNG